MPYEIVKQSIGGKFVVRKKRWPHKVMGSHDTIQDAEGQIAAIEASEHEKKA